MNKIKILWENNAKDGKVWASHGTLADGCGQVSGNKAEIDFAEASVKPGPFATLVHVEAGETPFSFFLRDVSEENPIYLPACGAVVTTGDDARNYTQIVSEIAKHGGKSIRQQVEEDEEYSYDRAARETRNLKSTTWLGVSKDMRIFQVDMRCRAFGRDLQTLDEIRPTFFAANHTARQVPELDGNEYILYMITGRGIGCQDRISKCLEEGYMPILNTEDIDDGIIYRGTYFAAMEKSPLDTSHLRGTDMYVADACGYGNMQTSDQKAHTDTLMEEELFAREEETVLYLRITAENTRKAPAYGFVRMPDPLPNCIYGPNPTSDRTELNPENGFLTFASSGRVSVIGTLNGAPIPSVETAVLIPPGEKAVFDFKILHTPISQERAAALTNFSFEEKFAEVKAFWKNELMGTAKIHLPEKRIEEMIKAGLLHMDLGFFGKNPDGPVVPIVGKYTAIGSESSPGIQFLDAVGMHELAARALQYFVEKQHEDGFMQNFGGYMLETGSVLWSMGEHWRMTRDEAWVRSVRECIIKAADYLVRWREENLEDEFKDGKGYGMIKGKVADPEDHFHSFMLNAGAYAGLRSAGEMLQCCDPENAARFTEVAAAMRENIRESFFRNMALSPAIPASDGTWFRSSSTWTETVGPLCLFAEDGKVFTHGAFTTRDFIGSNYLILQGVIDADEPVGKEILTYFTEFLTLNNVCFSQPYYSPHPYGQLLCGDVKLFLQEFYCGFAGLADRGTYSFWEHYFYASPHKLHEEAWFLMRCRWMLALEEYEKGTLKLMAGVPRAWLENEKQISVEHMKTYYGDVSFIVDSQVKAGVIHVTINLDSAGFPQPDIIVVRIPHPKGLKAKQVTAGTYDPDTETVTLKGDTKTIQFEIVF